MKSLFLIFCVSIVQCHICPAQDFVSANRATNRVLSELVVEGSIPGLAIAIGYGDELIYSHEYGQADLEVGVPVSAKSKFRIASLSKLFTGTAILKLHKQRLINLEDPISMYLDSIPDGWKAITIRQLAQHSSGIGHYLDVEDAMDVKHYRTTSEALGKFKGRPLAHAPDRGITYSSYAYTVLAAIIENVTNKAFQDAMDDLIFDPLEMDRTEVDDQRKIIEGRTGFYQYDADRKAENAPYIDLSGRWAGSGYLSTAMDLVKFGSAHIFGSTFLTKEELDQLTSPSQINDTLRTKEGLGWGQRTSWENETMYWGDGKTPGSTCGLLVFPEYGLTIAIVCNMRNAPLDRGEFELLSKRYIAAIADLKVEELKPGDLGDYTLDLSIQQNVYKGKLRLQTDGEGYGFFEFHEIQNFPIVDAFWINDKLWIFAVGGGNQPISIGVLPIQLGMREKEVSGEIFRIAARIEGSKGPY